MTATAEKPHPLYRDDVYAPFRVSPHTRPEVEVLWADRVTYAGPRRGWKARRNGARVKDVTWQGYFAAGKPDGLDAGATLYVESSGGRTVFTLLAWNPGDRVGNPTKHLDSFTCPADVNGLFLTATDPKNAFAVPLAEYLMERECPPAILAFFW